MCVLPTYYIFPIECNDDCLRLGVIIDYGVSPIIIEETSTNLLENTETIHATPHKNLIYVEFVTPISTNDVTHIPVEVATVEATIDVSVDATTYV